MAWGANGFLTSIDTSADLALRWIRGREGIASVQGRREAGAFEQYVVLGEALGYQGGVIAGPEYWHTTSALLTLRGGTEE